MDIGDEKFKFSKLFIFIMVDIIVGFLLLGGFIAFVLLKPQKRITTEEFIAKVNTMQGWSARLLTEEEIAKLNHEMKLFSLDGEIVEGATATKTVGDKTEHLTIYKFTTEEDCKSYAKRNFYYNQYGFYLLIGEYDTQMLLFK